jgi:solute carrier family 25 carnitine/acylcarnitine transporter 20/29
MYTFIKNNVGDDVYRYFVGGVSGMTGVFISHPIDTIKTNLQAGLKPSYNIINLYRGIKAPLIGVGFEKAVVFGSYTYLRKKDYSVTLSGAASGFIASFIVTPYERLKILNQTFKINTSDVNLITIPNLYKGFTATFIREVPGFAIYFSTYHYLKEKFYVSKDKKITPISSFLFGAASGSMAWIFIYPQDRIKTIIQANTNFKEKKIIELFKETWNKGGIKSFYSGFSYALSRAILLHAGTFMMFEILTH